MNKSKYTPKPAQSQSEFNRSKMKRKGVNSRRDKRLHNEPEYRPISRFPYTSKILSQVEKL